MRRIILISVYIWSAGLLCTVAAQPTEIELSLQRDQHSSSKFSSVIMQISSQVAASDEQPAQLTIEHDKSLMVASLYTLTLPYTSAFWSIVGIGCGAAFTTNIWLRLTLIFGVVFMPIALWRFLKSHDRPGYVALVPVLSTLHLLDMSCVRRRWALLLLIPFVGALALHVLFSIKIVEKQNAHWSVSMLYFFLPAIALHVILKPSTIAANRWN